MTERPPPVRPGGNTGRDRRQYERLPPSRIKALSVEIGPGRQVALQDISRGGVRFLGDVRLAPGHRLSLRLVTPDGVLPVEAKVLRSRLIRIEQDAMVYEAAVEFTQLLPEATLAAPRDTALQQPPTAQPSSDADVLTAETDSLADDHELSTILVTVSVTPSLAELQDIFAGNDW